MSQNDCECELTEMIGADTSTVSKHLAVLKGAGVVTERKAVAGMAAQGRS